MGRGAVSCGVPHSDRRVRRAGILRRRPEAHRAKGEGAKVSAETLRTALAGGQWGGPHHVSPGVLSLSQATECGTIYPVIETKALADIAHQHGMAVHMDGARLGNAPARM